MKDAEASSTAVLIAAALSYWARTPKGAATVPEESRRLGDWLLQNYSGPTRRTLNWLEQGWFQALIRAVENVSVPGIIAHYAARKQALEKLFREEYSFTQLVVLGAGFDTLALRLVRENPGLVGWEVDHPATQAWKTKAVTACNFASQKLHFQATDLSRPLPAGPLFPSPDHQKQTRTFWIAEGLLMYFPRATVEDLFRSIHQTSAPGSRFAFTFMEPQPNGRIDFCRSNHTVHLWLNHRREPFAWGIHRTELAAFLFSLGFRLLPISHHTTQEVDRLGVGEYLALAEVNPTSP